MPRGIYQRKKEPIGLVDPPAKKMEDLSNVNELLSIRKEEYLKLQHDMNLVNAKIQSEKAVWSREKNSQKVELELERLTHREEHDEAMKEVSRLHRVAQESVERANAYDSEWKARTIQLNEKEASLGNLSQERIEISRLRHDAEVKMSDANSQFSHALTVQNQATDLINRASTVLKECETRNQLMNDEWNKLNKWQEDLTLRQKDYEILKSTAEERLAQLKKQTEEPVHAND